MTVKYRVMVPSDIGVSKNPNKKNIYYWTAWDETDTMEDAIVSAYNFSPRIMSVLATYGIKIRTIDSTGEQVDEILLHGRTTRRQLLS